MMMEWILYKKMQKQNHVLKGFTTLSHFFYLKLYLCFLSIVKIVITWNIVLIRGTVAYQSPDRLNGVRRRCSHSSGAVAYFHLDGRKNEYAHIALRDHRCAPTFKNRHAYEIKFYEKLYVP